MSFIIDKQTLNDLGIFSHKKDMSVYAIYNNARTRGGSQILEEMFFNPLDSYELIRRRATLIDYFQRTESGFPFRSTWFDAAEFYLSNTDERTRIVVDPSVAKGESLQHKFRKMMKTDTEFEQAESGMVSLIAIVNTLDEFTRKMAEDPQLKAVTVTLFKIREILRSPAFVPVIEAKGKEKMTLEEAAFFDSLLRYDNHDKVRQILDYIYHLDVYISVAGIARERNFVRAEVLPVEANVMEMKGAFHPMLKSPVANDLTISAENNIIFLTGANMAGKSTLMKSFGIAVYMAHMGFPVAARSMRFTVQDGMYTSINVPDNINMGYSHFYAEVLRVKKVAIEVSLSKRLVVIFDELFKGTNVKDAYDATFAVTSALTKRHACSFMISTHIIEVGQDLSKSCDNVTFAYLPTVMNGSVPTYTYKLEPGITNDKHGMIIINNERIVELIRAL